MSKKSFSIATCNRLLEWCTARVQMHARRYTENLGVSFPFLSHCSMWLHSWLLSRTASRWRAAMQRLSVIIQYEAVHHPLSICLMNLRKERSRKRVRNRQSSDSRTQSHLDDLCECQKRGKENRYSQDVFFLNQKSIRHTVQPPSHSLSKI